MTQEQALKILSASHKNKKPVSIKITVEDRTCAEYNYGNFVKIFAINGLGRSIFSDRFAYVIKKENGILADIYRYNLFCSDTQKSDGIC